VEKPTAAAGPVKITDLLEALSQLAEIDDRFGSECRSQYGQVMMPSQKRALSDMACTFRETRCAIG